jgi:hypothetical protein
MLAVTRLVMLAMQLATPVMPFAILVVRRAMQPEI